MEYLFGFLVQGLFFAELAKLLEFQAFGSVLLVLVGLVIQVLADRALHIDEVVLGHVD